MKERDQTERERSDEPDFVEGVSSVVDAALGVGASIARVLAEATAETRPVEPPKSSASLDAMIHYGLATVTNVAQRVTGSVKDFRTSRDPTGKPAPARAAAAGAPRVHAGSTLRVPLSIENPSETPMSGLAFRCRSLDYLGEENGPRLGVDAVRFHPAVLDIRPRDFEKLTVFVDAGPDTAPGRYRAELDLGSGGLLTPLEFEVVPEERG